MCSYMIDYVIRFLVGDELARHVCYMAKQADCSACINNPKKIIIVASGWFEQPSMPISPAIQFEGMPVLFGEPRMEERDGELFIHADFVASAFFMLSRYEELLNPVRDAHGRFPGKSSFPYRNGFLDRPVVDEYGHWLRILIAKRLALSLPPRPNRISKLWLTHDVDTPFEYRGLVGRLRDVASGIVKRHRFSLRPVVDYVMGRSNPYTFPWLLEFDNGVVGSEEQAGSHVEAVYFLLARREGDMRDNWYLEDSRWPQLLAAFRQYGVTLGLHVSYAAGCNMKSVFQEVAALGENLSPATSLRYARHHFLRMTDPSDFHHLESAGITDDFSVGYADMAGFRVGTCRPYRWIDPRTGRVGNLLVHPLTLMECTLGNPSYMGLDENEALAYSRKLILRVAEHGGECVLLWHNTSIMPVRGNWQRALYVRSVRQAQKYL